MYPPASIVGRSVKPFCQPIIAGRRLIALFYLSLKYGENGAWRLTGLKLGGEWKSKKVVLGLHFVGFQGIVGKKFEV